MYTSGAAGKRQQPYRKDHLRQPQAESETEKTQSEAPSGNRYKLPFALGPSIALLAALPKIPKLSRRNRDAMAKKQNSTSGSGNDGPYWIGRANEDENILTSSSGWCYSKAYIKQQRLARGPTQTNYGRAGPSQNPRLYPKDSSRARSNLNSPFPLHKSDYTDRGSRN